METMGGHVCGESFCTDRSELTGNRCWPQIRLVCGVTQQPRDPKHRLGAGNWSLGRVLLTPLKLPVSCLYTGGCPPDLLTGVQVRDAIAQYLPGSADSGNEAPLGRQDLAK